MEELETLTSNSSMLGSTEVAASVSVLVTATDELAGNLTVKIIIIILIIKELFHCGFLVNYDIS